MSAPGHKRSCPYRENHDFPCTCQPESIWGTTSLWLCECCAQPLSLLRYGLCEECEEHEYSVHAHPEEEQQKA